jgi:thioredoxin-dependent peroxiredoxin
MKPGDLVPDFTLPDQHGASRTLSTLLEDGPVVLFFYPTALSGGCTVESCHFRDLAAEFAEVGARRVGISTDSVSRQKQFSDLNSFDYPLLSDVEGEVAQTFGVKRRFGPLPVKRHTFVIGVDSRVIEVVKTEFGMNTHADKALVALREHAKA